MSHVGPALVKFDVTAACGQNYVKPADESSTRRHHQSAPSYLSAPQTAANHHHGPARMVAFIRLCASVCS